MSQKNDTPALIVALLLTAGILGGGVWLLANHFQLFGAKPPAPTSNSSTPNNSTSNNLGQNPQTLPPPPSPGIPVAFDAPTQVPAGTTVKIDGSTSMVLLNQSLKRSFEQAFPGSVVETNAQGSDKGILDLLTRKISIAAISRPLTPEEAGQGLKAIPVATDKIAIAIGIKNPFRGSLTIQQLAGIFQGKISSWSEVGGQKGIIQVINRPPSSGTHQAFQQLVLKGGLFGTTPNITTMARDATTPILQALGTNGISYATASQLIRQQTVTIVPIEGQAPESPSYPLTRSLYYVYKEPGSPAVQAFLGFVASPQGQQAIVQANQ